MRCYDIKKNQWTQIEMNKMRPFSCHRAEINLWEKKKVIVIYSRFGNLKNLNGSEKPWNTLWYFYIDTHKFEMQHQFGDLPIKRLDRKSSSAAVIIEDLMYIFGGYDHRHKVDSKFFKLDLNTLTWAEIETEINPSPRRDHTFVALNNNLFVFGGKGRYNL